MRQCFELIALATLLDLLGLTIIVDVHPYELSGRMKQPAAFAEGVAHGLPHLMKIEPFGALVALKREQTRLDLERPNAARTEHFAAEPFVAYGPSIKTQKSRRPENKLHVALTTI